jgi:hypothetical protein
MPEGIPPYVLVARIASILGMSFSLAIGLLMLIGGWILPAAIAFLFFIPSFGLLALVERHASAHPAPGEAAGASETVED